MHKWNGVYEEVLDNDIWDNGEDDGIDYSELDGYEFIESNKSREDVIEELKGTIVSGDCIYCGRRNSMVYEGNICFVCKRCGMSCHEDIYYQWISGFDIEFV